MTKQNHEQENLEIPTQTFICIEIIPPALTPLCDLSQGEIMQIVKNDKTNSKTLSGK